MASSPGQPPSQQPPQPPPQLPPQLPHQPPHQPPPPSPPSLPPHTQRYIRSPPSTASAPASSSLPRSRRHTLPFSFPPLFQSNTSSTSLAPSTAEGKPIPVDDSTAEHRTSALRQINTNFPSRHHRYAKSTGAQSTTYSQPVIVRSYYQPVPTRAVSTDRGVIIVNGGGVGRRATSDISGPASVVRRVLPFAARANQSGNGMLSTMARTRAKKRYGEPDEAKLPPVEAFRFKSFMSNLDEHGSAGDINADLDRIAEICAKSRYSLSNQYEVHYAPHGSGTSFLSSSGRNQEPQGPTLQVVSSDDERNMRRSRKRPIGARRNSRAMGTLETIMSSSRSSDEDKTKKKSAAELARSVRGRAARKDTDSGSSGSSSQSEQEEEEAQQEEAVPRKPRSRRSSSLLLMEGSRQSLTPSDLNTPRSSAAGLVSDLALPQTSNSQLEIRTAREAPPKESLAAAPETKFSPPERHVRSYTRGSVSSEDHYYYGQSIFSALGGWIPWRAADPTSRTHGRAEGSLRELLRTTDVKGKGVERTL